jgi:hypothetical protein
MSERAKSSRAQRVTSAKSVKPRRCDDLRALGEQGMTEVFIDLNFDPTIGGPDADPAVSMRRAEAALTAFAPARG